MIDAIVFDFDGVIIDTETPDYTSWQEVFLRHHAQLDRCLWAGFIGGAAGKFDIYRHLEELIGTEIDRASVRDQRQARYLELVDASPILPGIMDYIQDAKRLGLKLAVATSSSREWVNGNLETRALRGHFDWVASRNDVSMVKPDPELYSTAIARLGTGPGAALAIEDSPNGITAAKRAGLFCVAVPNRMTRDLDMDNADLVLGALSDMPLVDLLALAVERLGAE